MSPKINTAWITGRQSFQVKKIRRGYEHWLYSKTVLYMDDDVIDDIIDIDRVAGLSICQRRSKKICWLRFSSQWRERRHKRSNKTYCESKRQI